MEMVRVVDADFSAQVLTMAVAVRHLRLVRPEVPATQVPLELQERPVHMLQVIMFLAGLAEAALAEQVAAVAVAVAVVPVVNRMEQTRSVDQAVAVAVAASVVLVEPVALVAGVPLPFSCGTMVLVGLSLIAV